MISVKSAMTFDVEYAVDFSIGLIDRFYLDSKFDVNIRRFVCKLAIHNRHITSTQLRYCFITIAFVYSQRY